MRCWFVLSCKRGVASYSDKTMDVIKHHSKGGKACP
jgi:hypothetical protein